jgi:hypothetical protein
MRKIYIVLVLSAFSVLQASKIIKIDLTKQKLYAMENKKVVFIGNVSTGMRDYRTPRGLFRIIEKDRYHVSNLYPEPFGGAKMPYMLRLTNSGIAIHQGELPGYPASHGCIRVSKKTAKRLWRWAKLGTLVKIYGNASLYGKKSSKYYAKKLKKKRKYKKRRKSFYHKRVENKLERVTPERMYIEDTSYEIVELYDEY